MKSVADFISPHIAGSVPTVTVPPRTYCAFEGVPLSESGVLLKSVVKSATANVADTFRYPSEYVSPAVAACFKAQRELRGNLAITPFGIKRPLFSVESAIAQDRESWYQLLLTALNGRLCNLPYCLILTDEAKRRLWPEAVVTYINETFDIFWCVGSESRVIRLRTFRFGKLLRIATFLLTSGYSRIALTQCLMKSPEAFFRDAPVSVHVEKALSAVRHTLEFQIASYVARDLSDMPEGKGGRGNLISKLSTVVKSLSQLDTEYFLYRSGGMPVPRYV